MLGVQLYQLVRGDRTTNGLSTARGLGLQRLETLRQHTYEAMAKNPANVLQKEEGTRMLRLPWRLPLHKTQVV